MPSVGTFALMKTINVYVTDEAFHQIQQDNLRWVEISRRLCAEVGDVLLVERFVASPDPDDVGIVPRKVTHISTRDRRSGNDGPLPFDVCSMRSVVPSDLV